MDLENGYEASYPAGGGFTKNDFTAPNASGFSDDMQSGIDLNEQLIRNRPATFFMRVNSDAMNDSGIYRGDTVIIDRSVHVISGKVVIALLSGEMLIRRYEKTFNKIRLLPDSKKLSAIDVDPSCEEFSIWGVVTYVIHSL